MSDTAVNGSGSPLTMEPDDNEIAPAAAVGDVETGIIGESMDGEDEHEFEGTDNGEDRGDDAAGMPSIEDVKAGLQRLSGGIATAQDVENAARAEEGLPPLEPQPDLPLDFGPFNSDAALKTIFDKQTEIKALQADYDDKKEAAKEAKDELDKANRGLVGIIDSLKNRRQQALNPSQPYLADVGGTPATFRTGCPWERNHPGQACPICSASQAVGIKHPALESPVHPEHEAHESTAAAAHAQNVLEPLRLKLEAMNIFVIIEQLQTLVTEDLQALQAYADEPSVIPPQLLAHMCVAAAPGSIVQCCQTCDRTLRSPIDHADPDNPVWYPEGARVGFDCDAMKNVEVVTEERHREIHGEQPEPETRKPRSHARKNRARKTAPETERHAQAAEGRKRSDKPASKPKAKAAKGRRR